MGGLGWLKKRLAQKHEMPGGRPGRCVGIGAAKVAHDFAFVKTFEVEAPIFEVEAWFIFQV